MRPVPFHVLHKVAWVVFASLAGTALVGWWQFMEGHIEIALVIAFSGAAVMGMPLMPSAGWGVLKGGNLCKNRPSYMVAVAVFTLFGLAFWQYILFESMFDPVMAFGEVATGLIVVRAYSDALKNQSLQE